MEKINTVENGILALENTLGLSITIIDNAGAFHTAAGIAIFNTIRQSHKKIGSVISAFLRKNAAGIAVTR